MTGVLYFKQRGQIMYVQKKNTISPAYIKSGGFHIWMLEQKGTKRTCRCYGTWDRH